MLTLTICPIYIKICPTHFSSSQTLPTIFIRKGKKNPSEFSFPQRKSDYFTTFLFLRAKTTIRATAANRVITSGITFVVSPVLTPASADLLELLSSDFVVVGASLVLVSLSVTLVSDSLVGASVAGSVLGSVVGSVLGSVTGVVLGSVVGSVLGSVVGSVLGSVAGVVLGSVAGVELGSVVGSVLGSVAGVVLGSVVGSVLGSVVGSVTGASVSTASKIASIERYPSLDPFS